jgi:iron complex transport system substrate-binding protein
MLIALGALLARAPAFAAITVADDTGQRVSLPGVPQRIVSLAPGATEMLFAAGAGERVIATVEFADEPEAARRIPRIGDSNAVDMERLLALRPDLVVIWAGGGNAAQIEKLTRLHVPLYRQQADSLAAIAASLRRLGALTGTQASAAHAAADIDARLAGLARRYSMAKPLTALLEVWNRPLYTVGGTHVMSDSLRTCGVRNVFGELRDLGPVIDIEAVIARDPDLIIAVAPRGAAQEWLAEWKRFGSLRAVRGGALIAFEDQRLSRLGPSALAATEALCRAIDTVRRRE